MKKLVLLSAGVCVFLLTACKELSPVAFLTDLTGSTGSSATYSITPSGRNNIVMIAAAGAPLVNMAVTIKLADGTTVSTTTVNNLGYVEANLDKTKSPYLLELVDTSVNPSVTYQAILLQQDFDSESKHVSITPISTLVAKTVRNIGISGKTSQELYDLRSQAAEQVKTALQPILDTFGVSDSGIELLTRQFQPTRDKLDKALDAFTISCDDSQKACTIKPSATRAQEALTAKTNKDSVTLNLSALDRLKASVNVAGSAANMARALAAVAPPSGQNFIESVAPVTVIFGVTSWKSGANYSGTLTILNFSDRAFDRGSLLFFQSSTLKINGAPWNVEGFASKDGNFSMSLPSWASIPPMIGGVPGSFTIGFVGSGSPGAVTDLGNCNIGGQKCILLVDEKTMSVTDVKALEIRSWAEFVLPPGVDNALKQRRWAPSAEPTVSRDAGSGSTTSGGTGGGTSGGTGGGTSGGTGGGTSGGTGGGTSGGTGGGTSGGAAFGLYISATSSWGTGFNGQLTIKNNSATKLEAWSFRMTLPAGMTNVGWGNFVFSLQGSELSISNQSWNGAIAAGSSLSIPFGGEGVLTAAPTACKRSPDGGTTYSETVDCVLGSPTTNSATDGGQTPTTTPVLPPSTSGGVTTGGTTGGGTTGGGTGGTTGGGTTGGGTGSTSGAAAEPTLLVNAKKANQSKRVYVGYYPSWSDNWFDIVSWDGNPYSDDKILELSKFARIPAYYTHVQVAFANPKFTYVKGSDVWTGSGLEFNSAPSRLKKAINILHRRGMKVVLSIGGATYYEADWDPIAAEGARVTATGRAGPNSPIISALRDMVEELHLDGLDVDFEVSGTDEANITRYKNSIKAIYAAIQEVKAGAEPNVLDSDGSTVLWSKSNLLMMSSPWSTGADCTANTAAVSTTNEVADTIANSSVCLVDGKIKTSYWQGSAGRERQVFRMNSGISGVTRGTRIADLFDIISIMSYDARYENYDGVVAWQLYRDLMAPSTIVNIGLETAPEGWAGGILVVKNADAKCEGSKLLKDQFGRVLDQADATKSAYSVERYINAVVQQRTNSNPRDGAMIWQILKTANLQCGGTTIATPASIGKLIDSTAGWGNTQDYREFWK